MPNRQRGCQCSSLLGLTVSLNDWYKVHLINVFNNFAEASLLEASRRQDWLSPSMTIARFLLFFLLVGQVLIAQETTTPSPYKDVTDRLESMTKVSLADCRWHSDIPHPEDASVDDSAWKPIHVGVVFTSGVQVFRCWYTVPEKLNGYEIRDAALKVAFDLD